MQYQYKKSLVLVLGRVHGINRLNSMRSQSLSLQIIIRIKSIHIILLGVEVLEHQIEDDTAGARGSSQTDKHPQNGGVKGGRGEGFGEGGAKGGGEEVHGLHKGLHRGRGLGVGVFQTGDGGENLRETDQHVGGGLDGDVHTVARRLPVHHGGSATWVLVTGPGGVDQVLHDRGIHHGQRGDHEAEGDTGDRAEGELQTAHDGVHQGLKHGNEHDNRDRVKVLHQIIGNAVAFHLGGLGDEVAGELAVHDPVDRVEGEDAAGNQGTLELVDEVVVPGHGLHTPVLGLPAGFGGIHVAVCDHDPESSEGVRDDGALRRAHDVVLATENENGSTGGEHAETQQISRPEADVQLHVGGGQQRERTDVDTGVEDHVDTLNGQRRVDDHALTLGEGLEGHLLALVLVRNQRSHITLDSAGTQTDDQNGHDEATQAGAVLQSGGDGSADQDQQAGQVDTTEHHDRLVLAEVLIGNNGTKDGGNCRPCQHRSKCSLCVRAYHSTRIGRKWSDQWHPDGPDREHRGPRCHPAAAGRSSGTDQTYHRR